MPNNTNIDLLVKLFHRYAKGKLHDDIFYNISALEEYNTTPQEVQDVIAKGKLHHRKNKSTTIYYSIYSDYLLGNTNEGNMYDLLSHVVSSLNSGLSEKQACIDANVPYELYRKYYYQGKLDHNSQYPTNRAKFYNLAKRAKAMVKINLMKVLYYKATRSGDTKTAQWLLSILDPQNFNNNVITERYKQRKQNITVFAENANSTTPQLPSVEDAMKTLSTNTLSTIYEAMKQENIL